MRNLLYFPLFVLVAIVFAPSWRAGAAAGGTISMTAEQAPVEPPVALPNKAVRYRSRVPGR
jgi:hypothetical protein